MLESEMFKLEPQIEEAATTYRYLLNYFGEVDDPQRATIYNHIRLSLLDMADTLFTHLQRHNSNDFVYQQWRINQHISGRDEATYVSNCIRDIILKKELLDQSKERPVAAGKEYEQLLNHLFLASWLSFEPKTLPLDIESSDLPEEAHYLIVVGSFFQIIEKYSTERIHLLINYTSHHSPMLRQSALVCLLLTIYTHHARIELQSELKHRLDLTLSQPQFTDSLANIQKQLLQSRETEKITKRLANDILPEMMRLSSQFSDKFRLLNDNEETPDDGLNPEWKSILQDTALNNKMQELSELQMEGADIHMMTFASLKNSPFFKNISNWFLPFDPQHSIFTTLRQSPIAGTGRLLETIQKSTFLCNSDKFSLCITIQSMPERAQSMISYQFAEESEEMNRLLTKETEGDEQRQDQIYSNRFIRDLYRFLKLFPFKESFSDFFSQKLDLYHTSPLYDCFTTQHRKEFAEYLLTNEHYDDALLLYRQIEAQTPISSSENYQKKGYCLQKQKLYEQAIVEYRKAEIIQPDNLWLTKSLALCYKQIGNHEKAIDYYLDAEKIKPEDLTVCQNLGQLYAQKKEYEKALHYFYKIEFTGKNPHKIWRSIAWVLFLHEKNEEAHRYYRQIFELTPTATDYINAGHVYMVDGNIKEALNHYRHAFSITNNEEETMQQIINDKLTLNELGVSTLDFHLTLEKLKATNW